MAELQGSEAWEAREGWNTLWIGKGSNGSKQGLYIGFFGLYRIHLGIHRIGIYRVGFNRN